MTSMFWPTLGGALLATGVWFGVAAHDADAASRDITVHGPQNEDSPAILARDMIGGSFVTRIRYHDGLHCAVRAGGIWCGWKP